MVMARRTGRAALWAAMAVGAAALLAGGCSTVSRGGTPELVIRMSSSDLFDVGGRSAPLADLPALLKKCGAGPATSLVVLIPDRTPATSIAAVGSTLRSAGYSKVMLRKPRHAEAFTRSDAPRR